LFWEHVLKVYDFLRICAHISDRPKPEFASHFPVLQNALSILFILLSQ